MNNKLTETETEQHIINLMLRDTDIVGETIEKGILPEYFQDAHAPLVHAIHHVYHRSDGKRLLTEKHYKEILTQQEGSTGDITIALDMWAQCRVGVHHSNTKEDFDLLLSKVIDTYVHGRVVEAFNKFNTNIPSWGELGAAKELIKDLQLATGAGDAKRTGFVFLDEYRSKYLDLLETKIENPDDLVICDIPEIDDAMNNGFKPGQTTLFIGATGSNKTNIMLNVALRLYERGINVLFLSLEMATDEFVNRLVSNRAGIKYTRILNPGLLTKDERKKIADIKLWLATNGRFAVMDVDEQMSISVLRRELDKRKALFQPRVVFVDYLGLLKSEVSYANRHDLELGSLTKTLKYLGKRHGFHVVTAAQLGRADIKRLREEGSDAQLDSTAVKGSQEVAADVEFIFAITKVPDEDDRLKLHIVKSRYGPSGHTTELVLKEDMCLIYSNKITLDNWQ